MLLECLLIIIGDLITYEKFCCGNFVALILNLAFSNTAFARQQTSDRNLEKVEAKVSEINGKSKKKIVVKLKDGTKVKGILTTVNPDGFDVTDEKTGKLTSILYSQADKVRDGGGLSTTSKILIGAGVGVAATFAAIAILLNATMD